jgi:hypothetical protein
MMKEINAAAQKSNAPGMRWVSQVTAGGNPGTYYITRLMTSLVEMDQATSLQEMLGEEGYARFQKMTAEAVAGVEYVLYRVLPELSNLPPEVTAVAPEFWNPKPTAAAASKPKATEAGKPATKPNP